MAAHYSRTRHKNRLLEAKLRFLKSGSPRYTPPHSKNSKNKHWLLKLLIGTILVLCLLIFVRRGLWNGRTKLTVLMPDENGNILVYILNPAEETISVLEIPKNTSVEVSRGLGKYPLGSVWQLGINEHLEGKLVAETVTTALHIPVFSWADIQGRDLVETNLIGILKAVFYPFKTNVHFTDKIRIAILSVSIGTNKRRLINLADTSYLKSVDLESGREFVVGSVFPQEIKSLVVDDIFSRNTVKVDINDNSGVYGVSDKLGGVVESVGAKVVSVNKGVAAKTDCVISGKAKTSVGYLSLLLDCKQQEKMSQSVYDIEITIGEQFAERF